MESATQMQDTEELLKDVVREWLNGRPGSENLTPIQLKEVVDIARGHRAKDVSQRDGVSPETVRARRKRVYSKLNLFDAKEVQSGVLYVALRRLAAPKAATP